MPAASARFLVGTLRPASDVRTAIPFAARRPATPLPIIPAAITATDGVMASLLGVFLLSRYWLRNLDNGLALCGCLQTTPASSSNTFRAI
jgi:hypothetical protein